MSKIIGIDLGTTNSAVAIYEGKDTKIIPNAEGKNTTPSIVAFTKKGEILIGDPAKRQAVTNSENTIEAVKRIMGLSYKEAIAKGAQEKTSYKIVDKNGKAAIQIEDKVYIPEEISSKILAKLKKDAEDFLGEKITEAVITVPAYFNSDQRRATQEAGKIIGLDVKRVINEPTAASLAYGLDKKNDQNIIVYDFGGGTMDVSLLEIGDGTFEVLATDGNAFLGGVDLDQRLTEYLLKEFKEQENIDLSTDKMAMQRIMDAAENAKKELSSSNETTINLPFITATQEGPKHFNISITRTKFEGLIEDLIDETIQHIETVLHDAEVSKNDITEIVMVGGSTRIPLVEQKVSEYFNNKKLNKSVNPDEVVAAGASIQGGILQGDVKDILLLDVTPLSLGIEVMGGVCEHLIEKGTTIPTSKSQIFSNAEDNQPEATIHVVQGENKIAKSNKSLGQFNVELTKAPRGTAQVEVKFDIDANGVLTVSAIDKATGKENNITISGSSGLTEEEINKMIQEAEIDNKKNEEKIKAIQKRNELDTYIYSIEKSVSEMNQSIEAVPGLQELINKGKKLVSEQSENKAEIEDTINQLQQLSSQLQQQNMNNSNPNQSSKTKEEEVIDAEIE